MNEGTKLEFDCFLCSETSPEKYPMGGVHPVYSDEMIELLKIENTYVFCIRNKNEVSLYTVNSKELLNDGDGVLHRVTIK